MEETKRYSFQTGVKNSFTPLDYVLFSGTLVISTAIGVFYAVKDRKRHSTKDFLLAGGKMHFIPVGMSLLASFMSAITLLGTPAEMYNYGTMYWWIGLSYFFTMFMAAHIYMPVFYNLKVTSAYEYLEHRFSKGLRTVGTVIFLVQMITYMAIVLYGPSLALNAVTGLSLWGAIISVGAVCTFYTAIGGMKAVLWTDTFQVVMMIAGLLASLIQGSIELGGFERAWNIAAEKERVYFNDFRPDPSVRHSLWSLVIGGAFLWVSIYGINQAQVQRAITCRSLRGTQIALWLNFPGLCIILYLCSMVGIVMYAFYSTCDPIKFGLIMASDQLYPLFVMDVMAHVPGVPGLFVACIFSGTLSTISSGLNSLAAVTLQDLLRPFILPKISERTATNIAKILAVGYGLLGLAMTYVASLMGNILQAALQLFGMIGAPMLGLFTLGMIFPWANKWGAYAGLFTSLLLMFWIGVGAYVEKPPVYRPPIETYGCNWNLTLTTSSTMNNYTSIAYIATSSINNTSASSLNNISNIMQTTITSENTDESNPISKLYTLSYLWYSPTAMLVVCVVGMIVSLITGRTDPKTIDPRVICPLFDILCPYLPEKILKPLRFGVNHKGKYKIDATQSEIPLKNSTNVLGKSDLDEQTIFIDNEQRQNGTQIQFDLNEDNLSEA